MSANSIVTPKYQALLSELKNLITQTQVNIERAVVRKKVEMAWSIGKSISRHLKQNPDFQKSSYGKQLFEKLESDVGIDSTVLYKMHDFYRSYPVLPKDNEKLNWNHYQLLSGIKKKDERKYLEDLVKEEGLSSKQLRERIKQKKSIAKDAPKTLPVLAPRLGCLGYYKLFKPTKATENYIDCGFKIYQKIPQKLPKSVKIVSGPEARRAYTYRGYLTRIVDGDTLRVTLDLGFGILHEEILRLRGINAIEASERGGKKATSGLQKILKNQDSFIVKTSSTDTYNRYLADIFLDDGTFVNQLLLDKKLAVLF